TIVVIGTGYVGLPAALMLAKAGHDVVGVDINENIVRAINEGVLLIKEEELQALLDDPAVKANLRAQSTPCEGDVFIIAVPTPVDPRKKVADMRYVDEAVESLLPYLRPGNLIIIESTVPPLTCRERITPVIEARTGLTVGEDVFLAHCPERILPGDIFHEIVYNDRIIGGINEKTRDLAANVYASFVKGNLYKTDDITAELVKLMENTYRDVNIALANEFAAVAETLGIDARQAIELANKHPRVDILSPGIGVGGHCIPIDPWFIKEVDPANSRLIFMSRLINDEMPSRVAARIRRAVREVPVPRIVALGAAYKPNVDDPRESPAIKIVELLRDDGYDVAHYDPLIEGMEYPSLIGAARGADLLAILVPHRVILEELARCRAEVEAAMRRPVIERYQ
ncbi:MAG TPA: nucleotide sugar dehydrogenase, partial [Aggregatilineales bacterium]|nr:nucleotide sugar dehydrogenase [Aggregatilineales bacterium]